jgi:hypothetical protein
MSQRIPIYIPSFISSINYNPAVVYPRLFFYNGKRDCETYWMKNEENSSISKSAFPYFDHYSAVGDGWPTNASRTLLFQNENPVYGSIPTESLYTEYWNNYITLLYNPRTRLINCKGIIPLAKYFKIELNDIVEFRGNVYHLRAINNYDLKEGTCDIQLLGPILPGAINRTL